MLRSKLKMEVANRKNSFYANSYQTLMIILSVEVLLVVLLVLLVLYQVFNRPLPPFAAYTPKNQRMHLTASVEPNLLPNTILKWASKAAVAAYTFDFYNYKQQLASARPYFTEAGWNDFLSATSSLIASIRQNQLIVNGVVSAPPVIVNQGELPTTGQTWRIQVPFLVTYQTQGQTSIETVRSKYIVVMTIVRIPTFLNPSGIGIDQFVMTTGG